MSAPCPNINHPEWKRIVTHLNGSQFEAYRAYIANDHAIPASMSVSDFKKHIGLVNGPFNSEQQAGINHKLLLYNRENGTSHRIDYTIIGNSGRQSKATLIHNYLPLSIERQTERRNRRRREASQSSVDGEMFQNVQDLDLEPTKPSEGELHAGRNMDKEFLPSSYMPSATKRKKLGPRFQPYIDMKQAEIDHLYTEQNRLTVEIQEEEKKSDPDKGLLMRLRIQREKVRKDIGKNKGHRERSKILKRLKDIEAFAYADIATLEDIMRSEFRTAADLRTARRIIKIWKKAGDFSGDGPHIFYDDKEFENRTKGLKDVTRQFKIWKDKVEEFEPDLREFMKEMIKREKNTKDAFSSAEIDFETPTKDVPWLQHQTLDISQTNNILFQIAHRFVKDANTAGHFELIGRHKKIDELVKKSGLNTFEIFQQNFGNDDNRKTGDLVYWFSYEYNAWKQGIDGDLKRAEKRAMRHKTANRKNAARVSANKKFVKELRENTTFFNPEILFWDENHSTTSVKPSDETIAAHEDELRTLLGDRIYQKYYDLAEQKIKEYKADLEARETMMEAEYSSDPEAVETDLKVWKARNSPYIHAKLMKLGFDKVKHDGLHIFPTSDYVFHLPLREKDGESTGFYDDTYSTIEQDPKLLELHEHLFELFVESTSYLPSERMSFMNENSVPFVEQKTLEAMTGDRGSLAAGFSRFQEMALNSVRMDDLAIETSSDDSNSLQLTMIKDHRQEINDYITLQDTQYRKEHKKAPGPAEDEKWRREIISRLAEKKSFDLPRLAKAYSTMAFVHKHKSSIEVFMRNMEDIIHETNERQENSAGEPLKDKSGNNKRPDTKTKRAIQMYDDFAESVFWGYPSNRPEGKGKKKVTTKEEKQTIIDIEQAIKDLDEVYASKDPKVKISTKEYRRRLKEFNEQIAVIGGVRVVSKFGDHILRYVQFLGMGWNGFAAVANMGFGFMSNAIEASDGRNYSQQDFYKAFALVMNSAVRNATFNMYDGVNGNAKKIRSLMDKYDVLKQSKNELYETGLRSPFKRITGKLKWLNPFAPQARTEYFNQAPVMIAILFKEKVMVNGKEMSLWDAYNEDGEFIEGAEISLDKDLEVKSIIDGLVKMNHGNYDPDSKISGKRKWIGRALFQFRSWAPQGFAERIRTPMDDYQLTNRMTGEDFVTKKGRYRSFANYYQQTKWLGPVGTIADLALNLTRKIFFQSTTFEQRANDNEDDTFTITDAANMRKNLMELIFLLGMMIITAILKATADDDEEKKKRKLLAVNFFINSAARMQTDILFYISPVEFERLTKNAMPMFALVSDTLGLIDSFTTLIFQGAEEDILQGGINRGKSETWSDAQEILPVLAQLKKAPKAAQMIYKK